MLIGELGEITGVSPQTIRFYERQLLMPFPRRAGNGYRTYDDRAVARISFIRAAQAAGLSLVEIRSVLDMRDHGRAPCRHVAHLIDDKLLDVRRRMADLAALEAELDKLRERGRRLDPTDCTDTDICHIISGQPVRRHDREWGRPDQTG